MNRRLRAPGVLATVAMVAAVGAAGCRPGETGGDSHRYLGQRRAAGIPDCVDVARGAPAPGGVSAGPLECLGGGASIDPARTGIATVYVLFAQWCGPCRAEMPVLAQALPADSSRVRVVLVNTAETNYGMAIDLLAETGIRRQVVVDPEWAFSDALHLPHSLPRTLFVSADGRLVHRKEGGWASAEELRAAIADKLGVQ